MTRDLFKNIYKRGLNIPEDKSDELFNKLDIFKTGYLSYTLFVACVINKKKHCFSDHGLGVFFSSADQDKDKVLSLKDIENFSYLTFKYKEDIKENNKYLLVSEFKKLKLDNLKFPDFAQKIINILKENREKYKHH